MNRTPPPATFRLTNRALLALTLCSCFAAARAQTPSAGPTAIERDREATRQQIESVLSDQAGELDNARTLGRTLPAQLQKNKEWAREEAQKRLENPVTQSTTKGLDQQWPPLRTPDRQRMVKRPATKGLGTEDGGPVFSPDFSRQKLTLAVLVNQNVLDLPDQEVANQNTDQAWPKTPVDPLQAYNLYELVGIGLGYSPVMDQTRSQLENAISRTKQARSDLLPTLGLRYAQGPEWSKRQGDFYNKHENKSLGLRLTQPIINVPLALDWLSEMSAQESANWRLQATRESVSLAVTTAVTELAKARVVLEFSDEQLMQFEELLKYVQSRAQTGATSNADLERAKSRVLLAKQIRVEQQAAYRNALLEVERLTGQVPQALILPYLNQLPGLPATQAQLRRLVWDHSYELRALRAGIASQENTVKSQYSKLLPRLSLSVERDEATNVKAITPKQTDNRLMGVLSWDLSLGAKEIYAGKSAASELGNRYAKLTEEGERLMQAVDADFALLQSATLRVETGEAEQRSTAAVVAAVREQLKNGRMGSLLEALDAFERHFAARQRLAQTLGQQMQAQAQLLQRLGMLSQLSQHANLALEPMADKTKPTAPNTKTPTAPDEKATKPTVKVTAI